MSMCLHFKEFKDEKKKMGQFLSNPFSKPRDLFYGQHEVGEATEEIVASLEDSGSLEKSVNANTKPVQDDCKKTVNGHRDMIAVKDFTINSLPEPYHKIDGIYNLTTCLIYLTVRIITKKVSSKRPEFVPNTNKECYPLYENRGNRHMGLGTGRICDVVEERGSKCTCKECKTKCKKSWTIKVFTATHVVFDDEEAEDMTCSLFYDDENKLKEIIKLTGFKKIWSDSGGDLCLLSTVTCNEELSKKLSAKIKEFNKCWSSLQNMHEKDKTQERLVILVSHPHGRAKRISFGFGIDIGRIQGHDFNKFVYSSPTCPGTSGGPVYVLGNNLYATEIVHGGALNDFTEIENIFKREPALVSKLFPSYQTGSSVIPLSFSSVYYTEDTSSEMATENSEELKILNIDPKFKFSNYSARWYPDFITNFIYSFNWFQNT
ncbi:hypothetical protein BgiMline_031584 [Biomphalaria glabrata]